MPSLARKKSGRSDRFSVRTEATYLIPMAGGHSRVLPAGEQEIAELIEVPLDDLTDLPFGRKSKMWMSRSKQIDDAAPINRSASHALKLNGLPIAVRGPVVVHHEKIEDN
jgi:hypothetical protein